MPSPHFLLTFLLMGGVVLVPAAASATWGSDREAEEACARVSQVGSYGTPPAALQEGARQLAVFYERKLAGEKEPAPPRMSPTEFARKSERARDDALRGFPSQRTVRKLVEKYLPSDYQSRLHVDWATPAGGRQFWPGAIEAYRDAADAWSTFESRMTQAMLEFGTLCEQWRQKKQAVRESVSRAGSLAASGDRAGARAEYQRALERDPGNAEAHRGLRELEHAERKAQAEAERQELEKQRAQAEAERQERENQRAQAQAEAERQEHENQRAQAQQRENQAQAQQREAQAQAQQREAQARWERQQREEAERRAERERQQRELAELERRKREAQQAALDDFERKAKPILENNPEAADATLAMMGLPLVGIGTYALLDGAQRAHPEAQAVLSIISVAGAAIIGMNGLLQLDGGRVASSPGELLLGSRPWWGGALELRGGLGWGVGFISREKLLSTRTMGPGALQALGGEVVGRLGPVRLATRGALRWADFPVEGSQEVRGHQGVEFSFSPGLQLFSGGLFSPWAEWRFMAYPNCKDELEISSDTLLQCDGPKAWSVGPRYGYHGQLALGNTFHLRGLGFSGRGGSELYADVAVVLGGITGPGFFLTLGTEWVTELKK